jgi:hypothetical protein
MYNCHRRHISTHPHTSERIRTRTPGRRCSPLSIRRLHSTHPIQHYTSIAHLFLYYVFNIEYNDNNNISAMNNSYILVGTRICRRPSPSVRSPIRWFCRPESSKTTDSARSDRRRAYGERVAPRLSLARLGRRVDINT